MASKKNVVETVTIRTTEAKLGKVYLIAKNMGGTERWFDLRKYPVKRISGTDRAGIFDVTVPASSHYVDLLADYRADKPKRTRKPKPVAAAE